jgi:cobalt-zinc-cadmium efflux system membrane fusion protein
VRQRRENESRVAAPAVAKPKDGVSMFGLAGLGPAALRGAAVREGVFGCFAAGLVALVLVACSRAESPSPPPPVKVEPGRVIFAPGSPQLASLTYAEAVEAPRLGARIPGRLVWDEERTARLFPAFGGRVMHIHAKPGDVVKAGQALAELTSPDFADAQGAANKAASEFSLAEKNLARVRLLVDNGVAPQKELAAAENEFATRRAELAQSTAHVKLYGGGTQVDASLVLRSPIAGTVVDRNINPGQELRPDMSTTSAPALFVITDPSRLWLLLDATERDLPALSMGESVSFASTAWPGQSFSARVISISDFVDPQTRTIKARCVVDNRDRRLKGEMYVNAEVKGPARAGLSVPAKAVFVLGDQHYLFVEEAPGRLARVAVEAVEDRGGSVIVLEGLRAKQRVVVDGSLFLQQILQQKGGDRGVR